MKVRLSEKCLEKAQVYVDLGSVTISRDEESELPESLRNQVALHPEIVVDGVDPLANEGKEKEGG